MAPGTNIGAASPVNLTPEEKTNPGKMDTHEKKAMNDAAAYIRSLAQMRGRNVQWGELAVTKAVSISAEEAKKMNVIDFIANDIPQLFSQIDGKKTVVNGVTKIMATKNMQVTPVPQDWRNKFLAFITDPNIAYLLMLAALYGLFFEFSNPGLILPGVVGIIALLLALYAFQLMPVNYVGLSLIAVGVVFMILELYVTSYGAIGVGGVIALVVGSIMLYDTNDPSYRVNHTLILTMSTVTAAFFFLLIFMVIRSHRKMIVTGQEALIGSSGRVINVEKNKITIMLMGEIWNAESENTLVPGQRVKVIKSHGLTLTVIPDNKDK
jgi:membrane-bound serine protease (ClpP class)